MLLKESKMGIPLGNDCIKSGWQFLRKEKGNQEGKSDNLCSSVIESNIFLLSIYDKSEAENISDKELKERLRG